MFEAIIRTKIICLKKWVLFSIDENTFQNIMHLEKDISEEIFQNICESFLNLPKLTSGLSCYLELYLDMVTFYLNTIYAQRTGNWKGFFLCIIGNSSHTTFNLIVTITQETYHIIIFIWPIWKIHFQICLISC